MKLSLLLSGAAIAQLASAHYFWETLIIDGKETKPYEFVRENTRAQKYNPTKWKNPLDGMTPDINDFRCNKGAFQSAGRTGVAEVKAGTKLALKLGVKATMQHPGPGFIHMSRAPGSVKEYEGDGDWFLVKQMGLCTKGDIKKEAWCTWDKDNIEFTIPEDLVAGEYLVRAMHVGVHGAHDGQAEFYPGCAQIKVVGSGKAVPKDTIKIPGFYKKDDPSWNFSVWGGYKDYPFPSQTVYQAGSGGGAQSPANASPASPSSASPSSAAPVPTSAPATQPETTQPEPSQPDYNEPVTPQPAQPAQPAAQPSTPAQKPKCNKHSRRGRRAFRETLRK